MRAETLAGAMGFAGLLFGVLAALPPAPSVQRPRATHDTFGAATFPPAPSPPGTRAVRAGAFGDAPPATGLEREIALLGRAVPRPDPLRRAFQESTNLMQFALDRLPQARDGDGASQYYIYLALDTCRTYLRSDVETASANLERILAIPDLSAEERSAWQAEHERCRGFTAGEFGALGTALGDDEPGVETEWASVWFERAALHGHAPALAEQALRPSPYGTTERRVMLDEAFATGGADVYWLLFAHSGDVQQGAVSVPALAWLLVACRAGQDCTERARWYRGFVCADSERSCAPGQSAVEYYWQALPPQDRAAAWRQAYEIEGHLRDGRYRDLPVPDLDPLDYRRLWGATGS